MQTYCEFWQQVIVEATFLIDHELFFSNDLHVKTLKSSCFFLYIGIQMEKISHKCTSIFNHVSGRPQVNYFFLYIVGPLSLYIYIYIYIDTVV